MPVSLLPGSKREATELGRFLRDRREKLDPAAMGLPRGRRRTPGLRREEVAAAAGVSVTWYTWLEQGRTGDASPSVEALEGIAAALRLDAAGREHLFLLAHNRPAPLRPSDPFARPLPAAIRSLLESGLKHQPALVRTTDTWDVIAWNDAAVAVFGDYADVPPESRNVLRRIFLDPAMRTRLPEWEHVARRLVANFRGEKLRHGSTPAAEALVRELSKKSPEFARLWSDESSVESDAEGDKIVNHPAVGSIRLQYATLALSAVAGLTVTVFLPAGEDDRVKIAKLVEITAGRGL
jgi:transcriptional regulator with XRE-family HTH domain